VQRLRGTLASMEPLPRELTLDQFVLEMGRTPVSDLMHDRFVDLVDRLRLSDELLDERTHFLDGDYARNLVLRTPHFELLVLCWRPGQMSTIHDHAGSLNAIRVRSGELTSRVFRPVTSATPGAGPVELASEDRVRPGESLIGVDRGGIHQLGNTTDEPLVTVHVYAPPLLALTVYDTDSPVAEKRSLRRSYVDDL
jgi:cysteine dioxygenase